MQLYHLSRCVVLCTGLCTCVFCFAQEKKTVPLCGHDHVQSSLIKALPEYRERQLFLQRLYEQSITKGENQTRAGVYTLPVVVHVIHDGAPVGDFSNPTQEYIESVVEEASQRFRHQHPAAQSYTNPNYGVDTEFQLCMVNTDPNGNFTNGVTRHYRPDIAVGSYWDVVDFCDSIAWDRNRYCNLFIMKEMTNASGVYFGGFYDLTIYDATAFFPGVVNHEIGHYLSLLHTFAPESGNSCTNDNCLSQGDYVCDTPPKSFPGSQSSCLGLNSCTTDEDDPNARNPYRSPALGGLGEQNDMLENYMDYSSGCWDAFTQGQKDRMRFFMETYRTEMLASGSLCNGQEAVANDAALVGLRVTQIDLCTKKIGLDLEIQNTGNNTITSLQAYFYLNETFVESRTLSGLNLPQGQNMVIPADSLDLLIGSNLLQVEITMVNGQTDGNAYNNNNQIRLDYLGGSYCGQFADCTDLNPQTASGPGAETVVDLAGPFPDPAAGADQILICIQLNGDFSWDQERMAIYNEYGELEGYSLIGADCAPGPIGCFYAEVVDFLTWTADEVLTLTLDPVSDQINPNLCQFNEACLTVLIPQGQSVPEETQISETSLSGLYEACGSIETEGEVRVVGNTTFRAGASIALKPGFSTSPGVEFTAAIDPDIDCGSGPPQELPVDSGIVDVQPLADYSPAISGDGDFFDPPQDWSPGGAPEATPSLVVLPNPVRGEARVLFDLDKPGPVRMDLMNLQGQVVQSPFQSTLSNAGQQTLSLTLRNIPPGIYWLRLVSGEQTEVVRLVKQ